MTTEWKVARLAAKMRERAGTCSAYETIHRKDGHESMAEYHRGGKEAFDRCAADLLSLIDQRGEPVAEVVVHVNESVTGVALVSGVVMPGTYLVYLHPPASRERDLDDFLHNELPDILAQVSAGLLDASMAHALIHKAILSEGGEG